MNYAINTFSFLSSMLRLLVLAFILTHCNDSHAETQNELYQRIFGENILNINQNHITPIFIGEKKYGDIRVIYKGYEASTLISIKSILKVFKNILRPELLIEITSATNSHEYLSTQWFARWGLKINYDHEKLILTLSVPAEKRKLSIIHLAKPRKSYFGDTVHIPSNFSAYVNIFYEQEFERSSIPYANNDMSNITLKNNLNYKGWVLESSTRFSRYSDNNIQHGDIKLVKDNISKSIRYTVGDVTLTGTGFQNTFSVRGLNIKRFNTSRRSNTGGQTFFSLQHESTVEILINGLHYKTLRLNAGRHDLRDFPIANGINNITIIINDIFGNIKIIEFPLFSDIALLEKDSYDYDVGLGIPNIELSQYRANDDLALSFFFRKGISSHLTLGLNYQNYKNSHLLGAEMRTSAPYGNFILDSAISNNVNNQYGIATNIGYSYQKTSTPEKTFSHWEFSATAYSPHFATPSIATNKYATSFELNASVSIPIETTSHLSLRSNFKKLFSDSHIRKSFGLFFRKRLTKNINWNLSVSEVEHSNNSYETNFTLHIDYQFGKKRNYISSSYDSATREHILNWRKNSTNIIGDIGAELKHINNTTKKSTISEISYNGSRFDTLIQHTENINITNEKQKTQTTRIQLATALVYADGLFSLSRVIADSFAIVIPHSSMADQKVVVDPIGNSFLTETSIVGPAVVYNLASYAPRELFVDIPNLPVGYNIGNGLPYLMPTYRSGIVITLGNDANVILRGRLNSAKNKPMKLTTGTITALDDPDKKSVLFFTNRNGLFQTDSLKPGAHLVKLTSHPNKSLIIEIPHNAKGIYDAGILQFK